MKFVIRRASKDNFEGIREFTTIPQLIDFMGSCNHDIIIRDNFFYQETDAEIAPEYCEPKYEILIYDDYVE